MPEEKKRFFRFPKISFATWLKIFVILIAFVAGIAVQHYYIEPLISDTFQEQITDCLSEKQLLNKEINNCYVERDSCTTICPGFS